MKTSAFRNISLFLGLCLAILGSTARSQTTLGRHQIGNGPSGISESSPGLSPAEIDKIIRAFTAKETEFRHALAEYAFERDARIQTIGIGGEVTGEYHRSSRFVFDDHNERFEKITFFPPPTLTEVTFTQEDLEDLGGVQPFALEASKLGEYNFKYLGKEHIDELDTSIFDVDHDIVLHKEVEGC